MTEEPTDAPTEGQPAKDAFHWRAIYDPEGNDILDEHEADGTPHKFSEIDQDRLLAFMLIPQWEGLVPHAVHLLEGQRLIFYRRVRIPANGPNAGVVRTAHVIGWQATIGGENVKSCVGVFNNGATLSCADDAVIDP